MSSLDIDPDERDGAGLLRSLPVAPLPPSRVDPSRAVTVGRRHRRARRAAAVTTAAAAVVGIAVAVVPLLAADPSPGGSPAGSTAQSSAGPTAPRSCTPTLLDLGGLSGAYLSAGDPTGRWLIGESGEPGQVKDFLIWQDGRLVDRPEMPGTNQALVDVNTAGLAVGWAGPAGQSKPYAYFGGGHAPRKELVGKAAPLPGVQRGQAYAVNDSGVIVGSKVAGAETPATVPVMWASSITEAVELRLPGGYSSGQARAVDDGGRIVGTVGGAGKTDRVYLWEPGGEGRFLDLRDPADTSLVSVYDFRGDWVVGSSGQGAPMPFRLKVSDGTVQRFPGLMVWAPVNENGWTPSDAGEVVLRFVGDDLLALPPQPEGAADTDSLIRVVSDDGRIVAGSGISEDGLRKPVIWKCR